MYLILPQLLELFMANIRILSQDSMQRHCSLLYVVFKNSLLMRIIVALWAIRHAIDFHLIKWGKKEWVSKRERESERKKWIPSIVIRIDVHYSCVFKYNHYVLWFEMHESLICIFITRTRPRYSIENTFFSLDRKRSKHVFHLD